MRITERNNSADPKVIEEGGEGGAPGTRNPLTAHRTHARAGRCTLKEAAVPEKSMLEKAPGRSCSHGGSTLGQSVLKESNL